jgi:hypothetical protein
VCVWGGGAWSGVQQALDLGGLGVLDMESFSMALHMRWHWLGRTDPSHGWLMGPLREDPMTVAFFNNSITLHLGDGKLFAFWMDPWLDGAALDSVYPELAAAVPTR